MSETWLENYEKRKEQFAQRFAALPTTRFPALRSPRMADLDYWLASDIGELMTDSHADQYTRDALAPKIARQFDFTPWAPLIFTSSVTGQNVTKLFDLALDIDARRNQPTKTRVLNDMLQKAIQKHPPAGLKNTHPKLRYMVQTDTAPPWFVIYGSNLKFVHWSYKRYLERLLRETYNYAGTPVKFSFRDEKQIKMNKERIAKGLEPVTKAYKLAKEAEKRQAE